METTVGPGYVRKPGHGHWSLIFIPGSSDNIKKIEKKISVTYGTLPWWKQQLAQATYVNPGMVTEVLFSFPAAMVTLKKKEKKISVTYVSWPRIEATILPGHVRKPGHGHLSLAFIPGSSVNI